MHIQNSYFTDGSRYQQAKSAPYESGILKVLQWMSTTHIWDDKHCIIFLVSTFNPWDIVIKMWKIRDFFADDSKDLFQLFQKLVWFREYPVPVCEVMRLKVTITRKMRYIADLVSFSICYDPLFSQTMVWNSYSICKCLAKVFQVQPISSSKCCLNICFGQQMYAESALLLRF